MNAVVPGRVAPEGAGASGVDAWSRLEDVAVPTTAACGDLDVPYLLAHTEVLLQRIPHARRVDLTDTAHLLYLERPDLVTTSVRSTA